MLQASPAPGQERALNVRGYFDHLLSSVDAFAACEPPAVEKWLDRVST